VVVVVLVIGGLKEGFVFVVGIAVYTGDAFVDQLVTEKNVENRRCCEEIEEYGVVVLTVADVVVVWTAAVHVVVDVVIVHHELAGVVAV
jgi:hypothetical protein